MSKYARVNLDIGHFTAANQDPIAYIEQHHDRISHLHIKDRKKTKARTSSGARATRLLKRCWFCCATRSIRSQPSSSTNIKAPELPSRK